MAHLMAGGSRIRASATPRRVRVAILHGGAVTGVGEGKAGIQLKSAGVREEKPGHLVIQQTPPGYLDPMPALTELPASGQHRGHRSHTVVKGCKGAEKGPGQEATVVASQRWGKGKLTG